jgi:hypothetical protein
MEKKSVILVQGNLLRLSAHLMTERPTAAGTVSTSYMVPTGSITTAALIGASRRYSYMPDLQGNRLTIEDNGQLAVGCYDLEITIMEPSGRHRRWLWTEVAQIVRSGFSEDNSTDLCGFYLAKLPDFAADVSSEYIVDTAIKLAEDESWHEEITCNINDLS